jgi:protoporphyrinogen oxidase
MAVVIAGAGVAGLTTAIELLRKGKQVLVLEKEEVPGGLCRSYRYGKFIFDIGPHRLFSPNDEIMRFFLSVLGREYIEVPRISQVKLNGSYHEWPFTYKSAFGMPLSFIFGCLRDLVWRKTPADGGPTTLEEFVVARYGKTIYDVFWRDYTAKFLGLHCRDVDAAWGALSVGRSIVDKNAQPDTILDMIKGLMTPPKSKLHFLYPAGGMGAYGDRCAAQIRELGGRILCGEAVSAIARKGNRIEAVVTKSGRHPVDQFVWTGRITDLCAMLGEPVPSLSYIPTILLNIEVEGELPGEWQWTYFPDNNCVFSRVSRPCKFSAETAPAGMTGLCVEVTDPAGRWQAGNLPALRDRVVADMVRSGLISEPDRVKDCHFEYADSAYPIYAKGFQPLVDRAGESLGKYENLHRTGRQALFVHDNIDEAVEHAMGLASRLVAST